MSGTPDSTLADLQQIIADLQSQLVESRVERDEAFERQTATAEVLEVINASPGDLAPVFEAMLEKALRLCGAAFGVLNTYDGKSFHRAATRGVPRVYDEWRSGRTAVSGPGTGHARIVAGEDVVHSPDLMAEPAYRDGDPDRRAFVELAGARTGSLSPYEKKAPCSASSGSIARRCDRSATSRSHCCRISQRRRSLRWRMHGY